MVRHDKPLSDLLEPLHQQIPQEQKGKKWQRFSLIPPSLLSLLQLRGFLFFSSLHSSTWPELRSPSDTRQESLDGQGCRSCVTPALPRKHVVCDFFVGRRSGTRMEPCALRESSTDSCCCCTC